MRTPVVVLVPLGLAALGLAVLGLAAFGLSPSRAIAQSPPSLLAAGDEPVLRVSAKGVQVYECKASGEGPPTWAFREPRAELFADGKRVGRHYAGPTWELDDGSRIVGRAVASFAGSEPGDIPWLRLAVVSHGGAGALDPVAAVQRIETHGGARSGPCDAPGTASEVPYTADYVMLRTAS